MSGRSTIQIETEAARMLIEWEFLFASEVQNVAKRLADAGGHPELITVADFRNAAIVSLQKLAQAIESSPPDGKQKVA